MKVVEYLDVRRLCPELLREVEMTGQVIQIVRDERLIARLEPVDEETLAIFLQDPRPDCP